jgi:hypothetical protein
MHYFIYININKIMLKEDRKLKNLHVTIKETLPLKHVNKLYETLTYIIDKNELSTTNTVLISTNLMQIVEKYPGITGPQKKDLVIHVLKRFVIDHLNGENKQAMLLFIDAFLPSVIDTIISVDKKELAIKIRKGFKACLSCC